MTTPTASEPLRILGIQVENMLKLKAVSLKPDPAAVCIEEWEVKA